MISRRRLLQGAGVAGLTLGMPIISTRSAHATSGPMLVRSGELQSIVVLPNDADRQVRSGGHVIRDYLQKATGVTIPVLESDSVADKPGRAMIYVGHHPDRVDQDVLDQLSEAQHDGFGIVIPDDHQVIVAGGNHWGTRIGCQAFCEKFLGVRWPMPTDQGEIVPSVSTVQPSRGSWLSNPYMIQRTLYPLPAVIDEFWVNPPEHLEWSQRHRTHRLVDQNHGIGELLDSSKYGASHPEIYPVYDGETHIPPAGRHTGWQPRFQAESLVGLLADEIIAYFDANPDEHQLALSSNDSSGYSDDDVARVGFNSVGLPHMSELYFALLDEVITEVNRRRPDFDTKTYGALAYRELFDAPAFEVNPQILPFVCQDRSNRVDPDWRAIDDDHLHAWSASTTRFALYDYSYGARYAVPRIHQATTQNLYRTASEFGARGAFVEWQTTWGEGPKPQTMLGLMWDPKFDVAAHDRAWYEQVAGTGANHLQAYFDVWDEVWSTAIRTTSWFGASKEITYGRFDNAGYLDAVSDETMTTAKAHLSQAREAATTADQRWRLDVIASTCDHAEAVVRSYPRRVAMPRTPAEAFRLLDRTADSLTDRITWAGRREELWDVAVAANPGMLANNGPHLRGQLWSGWNYFPAWELSRYIRDRQRGYQAVERRVLRTARTHRDANVRQYCAAILQLANGQVVNRGANPRFADGLTGWANEHNASPEEATRVTSDHVQPGLHSMRRTGSFAAGGISQHQLPASPGLLRQSMWFYVPEDAEAIGAAMTYWFAYDADGALINKRTGDLRALKEFQGQWTEMSQIDLLPEGTATVNMYVSLFGIGHGTELYCAGGEFLQLDETAQYTFEPDPQLP